jgi:hypothetical protein
MPSTDPFNRRQTQLLLKAKFANTSPDHGRGVRRALPDDVDVTLKHNGNTIHVNDARGLKTAREYLKVIA